MKSTSQVSASNFELSREDEDHLSKFEGLRSLLRDRVRTVAEKLHNGTYIVGRPGSSKSHTVCEELQRLGVNFIERNAKMTAPGLWSLLQENPESIIVLDDIPNLVAEKPALQILLAALGGEPGKPRNVTSTTGHVGGRRAFQFHGGIIAISNVPLRRDPLVDAVQSRVQLLEHEPTDEMLAAFMRFQAMGGYAELSPEECLIVVEFAIAESKACEYRLDLRLMRKAWGDFRLWKSGKNLCHWHDLVRSSMKTTVPGGSMGLPAGRKETKEQEQRIAERLLKQFPKETDVQQRNDAWFKETGKSFHTLLRHARNLKTAASM